MESENSSNINHLLTSQSPLTATQLEDIRLKLGMKRRQIAQLLGVDPSAWTRWTRLETAAPLWVGRALGWYQQLLEKDPAVKIAHEKSYEMDQLRAEILEFRHQLKNHQKAPVSLESMNLGLPQLDFVEKNSADEQLQNMSKNEAVSAGWKLLLLINFFLLGLLVLIQIL